MALAGFWEFPGGKIEPRESLQSALGREIREELGLEIKVGTWIGRGESLVHGREVVLDVFHSILVHGVLQLKEHAQTRWIGSDEIDGLDWAEADRPVLPILRRILDHGFGERPLSSHVPIVSVDWAKKEKGRAVYTARPGSKGWLIERPAIPTGGWSFERILSLAEIVGEPFGGSSLVAIDAVLGVPAIYGHQTGQKGFPSVMDWLEQQAALVNSIQHPDSWCPESPFFAVNAGEGGLTRFIEAAGGRAVLYRELERGTGGKTVFATSGIPGTVGSGSVALWREILGARRSGEKDFYVWPFEVDLEAIPSCGFPVIAESYPRACYAVALASELPSQSVSLAKTNQNERITRLKELTGARWVRAQGVGLDGIEWAERSEDDFDALMQAAALVRMIDSGVSPSCHLVDPIWEGGILGTGGLVLRGPGRSRSRRSGKK